MLEHANLLLQPPEAASAQAVVEPATGAPLGFSRRRPGGFWARWLGASILEVHEHEDASLLCTIRRVLLRPDCRLVQDADGRPVGAVRGDRLTDSQGRVVAVRTADSGRQGEVVFRDTEGRPLAFLRPDRKGLFLVFTEAVSGDPFAKMLVLAAALRG